jgi:hypothetical protein
MMLFNRKPTEPEPEISGADALRLRLNTWKNKPGCWHAIVRDVKGIRHHSLQAFADGADNLTVDVLKDLTKVMMNGHVIYDEASGKLKSAYADNPPTSIGIVPGPYINPNPTIAAAQAALQAAMKTAAGPERSAPRSAAPPVPMTTKRPGFIGDFYPVAVKAPEPVKKEKFVRLREGPVG